MKYADNLLARIKELKTRDKIDDFFGKPLNHKNNYSVVLENVCPCSAVELSNREGPWINRKYKFTSIPQKLIGCKFFPYKAKSKSGVNIIVQKNCLVRVIVPGDKPYFHAVLKWEKEGWRRDRSYYSIRTNDRAKSKFIVLTRLAKEGEKIRMNDYSGGIIVLAN